MKCFPLQQKRLLYAIYVIYICYMLYAMFYMCWLTPGWPIVFEAAQKLFV